MDAKVDIPWSLASQFWGYICAVGCINRAISYWLRPPDSDALSSLTFERLIPYGGWALILLFLGIILVIATAAQMAATGMFAHLGATLVYLVFVFTSLVGVIQNNLGWTGVYPLAVVALVHAHRVINLGAIVRYE